MTNRYVPIQSPILVAIKQMMYTHTYEWKHIISSNLPTYELISLSNIWGGGEGEGLKY